LKQRMALKVSNNVTVISKNDSFVAVIVIN